MTRIADHLLFQAVDDGAAVLLDERTGTEIVIPDLLVLGRLITAARYFYIEFAAADPGCVEVEQ